MENENKYYGIGFTGLLQVALIVLKLLNKISWKWIWVLAPTWIEVGIAIIVFMVGLGVVLIRAIARRNRKENR